MTYGKLPEKNGPGKSAILGWQTDRFYLAISVLTGCRSRQGCLAIIQAAFRRKPKISILFSDWDKPAPAFRHLSLLLVCCRWPLQFFGECQCAALLFPLLYARSSNEAKMNFKIRKTKAPISRLIGFSLKVLLSYICIWYMAGLSLSQVDPEDGYVAQPYTFVLYISIFLMCGIPRNWYGKNIRLTSRRLTD